MRTRIATFLLCLLVLVPGTGCGVFQLVGGASDPLIEFTSGELHSTEDVSLVALDIACDDALLTLGYESMDTTRTTALIRRQAHTAGGDPVEIQLIAKGPDRTELRIRVGVAGDEARARLVLEQIHQSL